MNADAPAPDFEFREVHGIAELEAVEQLQLRVWGPDESYDNKDILLAIQHEGGLVAAAFTPSAGMVAFVFGFPTRDAHVQHSHRLAVLNEWRRYGLGLRLKWFQRDWALARGITTVRWTYDPLRLANADLNIRRLGATAGTYFENYYGVMAGINAGVPSDRLLADWSLAAPGVAQRLNGPLPDDGFPQAVAVNHNQENRPAGERLDLDAAQLRLALPGDFGDLLNRDLALALEWRLHARRLFNHYFARGYRVTAFTRLGGPAYILKKNQGPALLE